MMSIFSQDYECTSISVNYICGVGICVYFPFKSDSLSQLKKSILLSTLYPGHMAATSPKFPIYHLIKFENRRQQSLKTRRAFGKAQLLSAFFWHTCHALLFSATNIYLFSNIFYYIGSKSKNKYTYFFYSQSTFTFDINFHLPVRVFLFFFLSCIRLPLLFHYFPRLLTYVA